jgi:AcrR family transcriptional regulator
VSPKTTTGERTQFRGDSLETRNKIRAAAARTIARQGIRGLRVEEVAAAAGVSTSLLYYHFRSRSGLVNAAFEYASEHAPSTALRIASDSRSGYEALEGALVAELDDDPSVRDYAVVWGEVCACAVYEPEFRSVLTHITRNWRATLAGAIERGIADRSIRSDVDPQETADVLISMIEGLSVRWLAGSLDLGRARELLLLTLQPLRA